MSFEHRQIGLKCFIVPFVQFKKREKPMEECYFKESCNFTKSNTPPWVFFTFFEFCKWY